MKIKNQTQKIKPCTNCFEPVYLKFNFSYIKYDKDIDQSHIYHLWDRMRELSETNITIILSSWGKERGFEHVPVNIKKDVPLEFAKRFPGEIVGKKFHIMRLYPNNNPTPSRIIGKIVRNVFYIFFIDINGNLYKH